MKVNFELATPNSVRGYTLARPTWCRMKKGAGVHCARAVHVQMFWPYCLFLPLQAKRWAPLIPNLQVTCMLPQHIRGVFKKFAAQPRRKTNFTTKRGVRDVTFLKRPLTQPLANRSSCFAQAVGCCKNVCYFCRKQRRSAGSSNSIRSVTEKMSQRLSMNTCWRHRGNVIFPIGVSKRGLSSSKLVDRTLKITSSAVVHQ